jgi:hypothetical protein
LRIIYQLDHVLRRAARPTRHEEVAQRGVTPTRRDAEDEDRGKQRNFSTRRSRVSLRVDEENNFFALPWPKTRDPDKERE